MIIYYRGPSALITDRAFEVWCPYRQRFAISELHDVHVVRGGPDPLAVGTTRVAGVSAVVVAALWPFLHSPASWVVTLTFVVVPGAVSGACWRLNRPDWELRATYRGYQVQLFRSRDPRIFGQVKRGLMRAMEAGV
jgi:Family of unknown function (DUF6232)